MTKTLFTLLTILFFSGMAIAQGQQQKLLHVNFEHAYGSVTHCPGSLGGVQALCHFDKQGWTPNESVAQSDSALQKELRAWAGQTDSYTEADSKTTNPTKIQGMQVAQGMKTANTAQSQMQGLDPNSLQNMSLADKMKFAQQLMANQGLQNQTALAQQQPAMKTDSLIKLLPTFDSLTDVMGKLRKEFRYKAGRYMAMADSAHAAINYLWRDSIYTAPHSDSTIFFWFVDGIPKRKQPTGDRQRRENQTATSEMCSQISQAASEFVSEYQPVVNRVDEYQKQLKDGNAFQTDEMRNVYRSMIGAALGGATDLQQMTESVITLGIRWLDSPKD